VLGRKRRHQRRGAVLGGIDVAGAAVRGAGALSRCFAAPILYDLAAKAQPVPAFHQVTRGNNGFYAATPGWNFATGLGSPDVFNLAQDYAAFLHALPSHTCPF